MTIKVGDSVNAIVTVSPSNARNKTLKWSSDDTKIATVSQAGRIRGVSVGTANITVETTNGKKQTFTVNVTESDAKDPFNLNDEVSDLDTEGTVTYTSYDISFPQIIRIQMGFEPTAENLEKRRNVICDRVRNSGIYESEQFLYGRI